MELKLKLLGHPEIWVNGRLLKIRELNSVKARALLFYLAVTQSTYSRGQLADLLYAKNKDPLRSLRGDLYKLRPFFSDYISSNRLSVGWRNNLPYILDTAQFLELTSAKSATVNELKSAVERYQGEFLKSFFVTGSPQFEAWAGNYRSELAAHYVKALDKLIVFHYHERQWSIAESYARKMLAADRFHEAANRHMMRILAVSGRKPEAVAHFDSFADQLEREIGVSPSNESFALIQEIEQGRFKVGSGEKSPPISNLPALQSNFVGRQAELATIKEKLLDEEESQIQLIAGMGGIGKTTLAIHVAHQLQNDFPDGILWTDARRQPNEIMDEWAVSLGYDFSRIVDIKQKIAAAHNMLAEQKTLIVLDDVVNVAQIRDLLPASKSCRVLMTTRQIDEPIELLQPEVAKLTTLTPGEAIQLLGAYAGMHRVASQRKAAIRLCKLTENHPLALEIAGKRLGTQAWIAQPLEHYVQSLEQTRNRLSALAIEDLAVRATFELSWISLPDDLKRAFASLAVFEGRSFAPPAFAAVLDKEEFDAGSQLLSLVALSLLSENSDRRFRQHALLADFALEKLADDEKPWRRLVDFFEMYVVDNANNFEAVDLEWDNLNAGISISNRFQWSHSVMHIIDYLLDYWFARGQYSTVRKNLAMAIEAVATQQSNKKTADYLAHWGYACLEQNDTIDAKSHFENALNIYTELMLIDGIGNMHFGLARIAIEVGDLGQARLHLENSSDVREELNDPAGLCAIDYEKARILFLGGKFNEAQDLALSAYEKQKKMGLVSDLLSTSNLIMHCLIEREQFEQALRIGEEGLTFAISSKSSNDEAFFLESIAHVYNRLGKFELALKYTENV